MKADLIQQSANGVSTSYDEVPYPSYPFAQTHPARLATIATLLGMRPAPVEHCRVLELGCAAGGNVIPLAESLPHSTFVGVDFSDRQIADGLRMVTALGLKNVELKRHDILEIDDGWGQFDYIICHGVYSWVPQDVRDKILAICKQNLAPQGVAYVSYNTSPGWNMRGTIRDIMCYHVAKLDNAQDKVRKAREILDFMSRSVSTKDNAYGMHLRQEVDILRKQTDSYLLHEHLEEINAPVYFFEFAAALIENGLQYLGEADPRMISAVDVGEEVMRTVRGLCENVIEIEQYLDFLRNRTFRQTLMCHAHVDVDRRISPRVVGSMFVSARLHETATAPDDDARKVPVGEPSHNSAPTCFENSSGAKFTTSDPILVAALRTLVQKPAQSCVVDELFEEAQAERAGESFDARDADSIDLDLNRFRAEFGRLYLAGMLDLNLWAFPGLRPGQREPARLLLRPLARWQAQERLPCTTHRHEVKRLSDFDRAVACLLDGQRDMEQICKDILADIVAGRIVVRSHGKRVVDEAALGELLPDQVGKSIERLRESDLLVP